MKNVLIGLLLALTTQISHAFERPFRIDKDAQVREGYAIAWGIPGKNLDFEFLDTIPSDQIETVLDFSAIRNFVVDVESNKILSTVSREDEDDYVVFRIGHIRFGNYYGLSLDKLAIQNLPFETDALAMTENFKWNNKVSKILLINREMGDLNVLELDPISTMTILKRKLKESILEENMDLYENGAETVTFSETKHLLEGEVNIISLDYGYPKQDESLAVTATVKMNYENGKVVPYILKVTQKRY